MKKRMRNILARIENWIQKLPGSVEKRADRVILIPIIIYAVFFSGYTCYMHYTFKTYAWDLGIVTQSMWTTLNSGKILYSTLEVAYGNPSGNLLGVHFSPILFLILPVYAIFQSPETLLIFQSFILAIAALPLYWIARDKLGNKLYALAFASAYLLNPALHGVNTYDFHVEIFTPLFILFAFYYLEKGKWVKALPFIILELTTIEFAPIIVFSLGLYLFLKKILDNRTTKQRKTTFPKKLLGPAALMVGSMLCLYLALGVISVVNPLKAGGTYGNWSYWGRNVSEVLSNVLRNPTQTLTILFTPIDKPYFLILLFSSTLFLPLIAPLELLTALPWLILALLTDYPPYYQPYYQYSALVIGQLFIAGVYGFHRIVSTRGRLNDESDIQKRIVTLMVVLNVLIFVTVSPVGISAFTTRSIRPYAISTTADLEHIDSLYNVLSLVPSNASIATEWDIFPHVCQRLNSYFLKWPLDYNADYILVDAKSPTFTMGIMGPTPDQITISLLKNNEYGMFASEDGVLLLRRGYSGPLEYYSPQVNVFNSGQLILGAGKIEWDYASSSGRVITSDPANSFGVIWFGPYAYFVQGNYLATFKLRTANETCQVLLEVSAQQGSLSVAARVVNGTEFKQANAWQEFSVSFKVVHLPEKLEFKGIGISNDTKVSLDYIRVEQIGP
jgi:uncharacterized membrane protein